MFATVSHFHPSLLFTVGAYQSGATYVTPLQGLARNFARKY
jgi:hypothetical protein